MEHRKSQNRHPPFKEYADSAARIADTDIDSFDEGRLGWQRDDNSVWLLTSTDPIEWTATSLILPSSFSVNYIDYNNDIADPVHSPGRTYYDRTDYTLSVDTLNGSRLQLGQETVIVCRNNTNNTILNGKAVYYTGVIGSGRPCIALAISNGISNRFFMGIATHDIPKNTVGLITIFGTVRAIPTSSFPDGTEVFLSHTVAGDLTNVRPPAPNSCLRVGYITYSHVDNGSIFVIPYLSPRLRNLSDSNIREQIKNDNHFIKYYSSGDYWDLFEAPWLVNDYDPTGFDRGVDSKGDDASVGDISFDAPTRTFTIEPKAGESSFWFYVKGIKFSYTVAQTVQITDVDGVHVVYFDENGNIQHGTSITAEIIVATAFVSYIYWDYTNKKAVVFADERHGYRMSGLVHLQQHKAYGSTFHSGLLPGNLVVDGSGDSNTSIQFSSASGEISDEDLTVEIAAKTLPANIPILYRSGANGIWRVKDADNFPLIYNGTAGYSGTLPPYNYFNGSIWTLAEATNNNYIVMLYFATTDASKSIIGVQSQSVYTNLTQARLGIKEAVNTFAQDGMAFVEYVALWGMIVQVSTGYANTPKARFRTLDDGRPYLDLRRLRSGILIE